MTGINSMVLSHNFLNDQEEMLNFIPMINYPTQDSKNGNFL